MRGKSNMIEGYSQRLAYFAQHQVEMTFLTSNAVGQHMTVLDKAYTPIGENHEHRMCSKKPFRQRKQRTFNATSEPMGDCESVIFLINTFKEVRRAGQAKQS